MTVKEIVSFKQDDDDDSGGGLGQITPFDDKEVSVLVDETRAMENSRRVEEQRGHQQYANVNARERHDNEVSHDLEAQMGPKEHPYLRDSQRYDGVDPHLNPEPQIGTDARREFDNERREQDKEKQLRLGNMPKQSKRSAPEFKP